MLEASRNVKQPTAPRDHSNDAISATTTRWQFPYGPNLDSRPPSARLHTHTPYLSRRRPPGFAISRALGAPNEWSQLGTIRKHEMSVYFFNSCAQRRTRRTRLPRRSHTPIITNSSSRASSPTKSFNHLLLRHRSDYVCGIDFSPSRPLRSRDIRTSPSLDPF